MEKEATNTTHYITFVRPPSSPHSSIAFCGILVLYNHKLYKQTSISIKEILPTSKPQLTCFCNKQQTVVFIRCTCQPHHKCKKNVTNYMLVVSPCKKRVKLGRLGAVTFIVYVALTRPAFLTADLQNR